MNRTPIRITSLALILFSIASETASAEIPWQNSPERVLSSAGKTGKPILVFVSANWCHYCKKMERETWSDRQVDAAVSRTFETLRLDGDRDKKIVKKLELRGFPATLLYTPDGHFIDQRGGYLSPAQTLAWLQSVSR